MAPRSFHSKSQCLNPECVYSTGVDHGLGSVSASVAILPSHSLLLSGNTLDTWRDLGFNEIRDDLQLVFFFWKALDIKKAKRPKLFVIFTTVRLCGRCHFHTARVKQRGALGPGRTEEGLCLRVTLVDWGAMEPEAVRADCHWHRVKCQALASTLLSFS